MGNFSNTVQPYLIVISIIAAFVFFVLYGYLRRVLKGENDNFLLVVGGVFLFWALLVTNEAEEGVFGLVARVLSIVTTLLILYSLRYFEDGITFLRSKHLWFVSIALALNGLALVFSNTHKEVWVITEASTSIFAVLLLCLNILVSLWKRKLFWLAWLPVLTMLVLIITQLHFLGMEDYRKPLSAQPEDGKYDRWERVENNRFVGITYLFPLIHRFSTKFEDVNVVSRMLSRPLLFFNVVLLTISWIGKRFLVEKEQQDEERMALFAELDKERQLRLKSESERDRETERLLKVGQERDDAQLKRIQAEHEVAIIRAQQLPEDRGKDLEVGNRLVFEKLEGDQFVIKLRYPGLLVEEHEIRLTEKMGLFLYRLADDRLNDRLTLTSDSPISNFGTETDRFGKQILKVVQRTLIEKMIKREARGKRQLDFKPEEIIIPKELVTEILLRWPNKQ